MTRAAGRVTVYYPRAMIGDGGATNSAWLWAESLQGAGVQVEVLHAPVDADEFQRSIPAGITTHPVGHVGRDRLLRPRRLGAQLHGTTLLVLHSGYTLANLVAGRAAVQRGVPYMVMPQGAYDSNVRSRRRAVRSVWEIAERRHLERAAAVHVSMPSEIVHIHALAPAAHCVQAPTAFPLPEARWAAPDHGGYLAWLGRYDIRHKGLDLMIDAMAMIPAQRRPMLVLRGRDSKDSRRNVQDLVSERGLHGSVEVGPPVEGEDKESFLLGASAYVHPSRWESYGVALVEAMAYGVPSLTTTDVGLGPLLAADGAARVVPGTTDALAQGLQSVTDDEGKLLGQRGRDWVQQNLSHEAAAQRLLEQLSTLGLRLSP